MLPSKLDVRHALTLPKNVHLPDRVLNVLRTLHRVETRFCISAHPKLDGTAIAMDDFGDLDGDGPFELVISGAVRRAGPRWRSLAECPRSLGQRDQFPMLSSKYVSNSDT